MWQAALTNFTWKMVTWYMLPFCLSASSRRKGVNMSECEVSINPAALAVSYTACIWWIFGIHIFMTKNIALSVWAQDRAPVKWDRSDICSMPECMLRYGEWEATGCRKSTPECNKRGCKTDLPQLLPSPLRKSVEQLHCRFRRLSCGSLLFQCIRGNVCVYHLQHPAEGQTCTDCRHIKKEG